MFWYTISILCRIEDIYISAILLLFVVRSSNWGGETQNIIHDLVLDVKKQQIFKLFLRVILPSIYSLLFFCIT